jgi:lysophospholipase L1-like esterase
MSRSFLALGDSYTIGEGVDIEGRWPNQLAARLGLDAPEILAQTGWTTDELSAAMAAHTFHPPYALVTLLIGVNDQYRAWQEPKCPGGQGRPREAGRDLAGYRDEFTRLLRRAIELAGDDAQRVVVVSIPDWGVTPFARASGREVGAIARAIDAYNAANREIAAAERVRYVDVTPISRDRGDAADMLVGDGLHPSAAMHTRWLDAIEPAAVAALSPR